MATIVTRSGKGSALTHTEMDANFTNLNNDKLESKYSGSTKIATTSTGIDVTGGINIDTGTTGQITLEDSATPANNYVGIEFGDNLVLAADEDNLRTGSSVRFRVDATERMRIDSSGNLLVGTTDNNVTNNSGNNPGINIGTAGINGMISAARYQGNPLALNRLSNDGDIISFAKDGTTVGGICNAGTDPVIYRSDNGTGLLFGGGRISPANINGSLDNAWDFGHPSYRWDDIYATNGTIQTSDRNEKQDIEELTEAEQRVAVACKGLMRKYRWKSAVAEKGDDARIHFGIIAQDLQDAFEAEGLDAHRYAMFTSNTWWETQTEVPAVEAVEEQEATYDDAGNKLTPYVEAVEAKEAYTRTDTYETQEEAPEGATERTRLGVRYPELLAFIISAL